MQQPKDRTFEMLLLIAVLLILFFVLAAMAACDEDIAVASAPCDSPTAVSLPLELNGEGEYCHKTSADIAHIDSRNMQLVEINGVDYTNMYSDQMPPRTNGYYTIHAVGGSSESHLIVIGSGGSNGVPVTGIYVDPAALSVNTGAVTTLTAKVAPENATEKGVSWRSSDTRIATVDHHGEVYGVSAGVAMITATTADGGFEAASEVTVNPSMNPQKTFDLTVQTNGDGSTSPHTGTHTYVEGTFVSVTATASEGSVFSGWSGAVDGADNPVNLEITSDQTLTANFTPDNQLPDECARTCDNAIPVYPTPLSNGGLGNVTMYNTQASNGGACGYGATGIMNYAAINSSIEPGDGMGQWQGGKACGSCAEVTVLTSQGLKRVVVRIVDECPDAHCGIDLGGAAPGKVMIDGFGRYEGQWRFVSCDGHPGVSDGPPSLVVFNGSNRWWSRILVRNGSTAVDTIAWQTADGGQSGNFAFAQSPENTYEVPVNEVLQSTESSFVITVHYADGATARVTLSPDELATPGAYPLD